MKTVAKIPNTLSLWVQEEVSAPDDECGCTAVRHLLVQRTNPTMANGYPVVDNRGGTICSADAIPLLSLFLSIIGAICAVLLGFCIMILTKLARSVRTFADKICHGDD